MSVFRVLFCVVLRFSFQEPMAFEVASAPALVLNYYLVSQSRGN